MYTLRRRYTATTTTTTTACVALALVIMSSLSTLAVSESDITKYRVVIDTRNDKDPLATLTRIEGILDEAWSARKQAKSDGSAANNHNLGFDRGRLKPNLEGILGEPDLPVLFQAGIKFKAIRYDGSGGVGDLRIQAAAEARRRKQLGASGHREPEDNPDRPHSMRWDTPFSHDSQGWNRVIGGDVPDISGLSAADLAALRDAMRSEGPLPIVKAHYHTVQDTERVLRALVNKCPKIMKMHNIGRSVRGSIIWAVRVSDNVTHNEIGEPELLIVGGLHGDEPVGREMCLWMLEYICDTYSHTNAGGADEHTRSLTQLIDSVELWVVPSTNPDGYSAMTRYNAMGVDLNRNFPDRFEGEPVLRQPETQALIDLVEAHTFTAALALHGASTVVSYPWDGNEQHQSGLYTAAPDDRLLRALAWSYAGHNPTMQASREFPDGITNGAHWYVLYGGMQDWAYGVRGVMQVTVELSNPKWPHASSLPIYWETNRASLFSWMAYTIRGVWGMVMDTSLRPVRGAYIVVLDRGGDPSAPPRRLATVFVDPEHGDYFRPLIPGSYSMEVLAAGYHPLVVPTFMVVDGAPQRRDYVLHLLAP